MQDKTAKSGVGFKDETGNKYGRLTVIKRAQGGKYRKATWLCQCACDEVSRANGERRAGARGGWNTLPAGQAAFNDLYRKYKASALQRGIVFDLSKEEFQRITKQPCHYCGQCPAAIQGAGRPTGAYIYNGADRVDNRVGYLSWNVVACCTACNIAKGKATCAAFLTLVGKIYTTHCTPR